ncbi:catalase-like [Cydia pomonella]|uniref:catalase-like n=1 Tax=Cydia pomonella TaxID=82600 RepID=UPI002ADDFD47|nr:catalase-like [Cydia pomonella]
MRLNVIILFYVAKSVLGSKYKNTTLDPASRQLYNFKLQHKDYIGILTDSRGIPVELRDTNTINSDLLSNRFYLDSIVHFDRERIPERVVHAKGAGAFGYFEVTHNISKYTKADVFNEIGKKTPLVARFSSLIQNLGGSDLSREPRGFAVKLFTKEGNLDLLGAHIPVFFFRDALLFSSFVHSFKRNPRTNLIDNNMRWDFLSLKPESIHAFLWLLSDYGIPNGYRHMNGYPIHTYVLNNKHGENYYARFNFSTEQGIEHLSSEDAKEIQGRDLDYFRRDLYNSIENKKYPAWKLQMDVMTRNDIKQASFNPFDVTRQWPKWSYHTVPIGRLVLNKNPDNFFKSIEQVAFDPFTIVPGIPGPQDQLFRGRHLLYRDAANYRLGINYDKIDVNCPKYAKTYVRDGIAPVSENMGDAPNYFPNSYNGPMPYIDQDRSSERLLEYESSAADFQPAANFYNYYVADEAHRQRLAKNAAETLATVTPPVLKRVLKLLRLIDNDLGKRVTLALPEARAENAKHR